MLLNCGVGEDFESPLDCKEIQPVHPKGNQSWIFIGRTDAEASILWPPDTKSQLIGKDSDAGKDWRQEEKGMTEDEMVGWLSQQALGDGEGPVAWYATVHGVAKSQTWLSNWTTTTLYLRKLKGSKNQEAMWHALAHTRAGLRTKAYSVCIAQSLSF